MINIEKRGRRIVVSSRGPIVGLKKAIPGAYLTTQGTWTVPLTYETCVLLRQKYGRQLKVGNELKRWALGVKNSRQYMAKIGNAADADLEYLDEAAPVLAKAMSNRTYQRSGARFVADAPGALIADEPGLGKTLIAIGGLLEGQTEGPYLVICPKTASDSVWRREIMRWLPRDHRVITMPQAGRQRSIRLRKIRYGPKTWVIINPEMVSTQAYWECKHIEKGEACKKRTPQRSKQQRQMDCGHIKKPRQKLIIDHRFPRLFEIQWGAIIADESHESLIIRAGKITQKRRGMTLLTLRPDGKKLALSGTPFDSKPHQLWGTLNWLYPQTYSAFNRWAEMFWEKGGYKGYEIGEFNRDREKLLWDSLSAVAIRRTKAEVAPDLPPKTYVGTPYDAEDNESPVGVWLEMDGEQARAYEAMEELSVAELESGRLEAITALAELTRLKQLACAYGDIKYVEGSVRCDNSACPRSFRGVHWHQEIQQKYIPRLPSNKFDWTVEALEEWGYPRNPLTKVVIVSFYTGILEMFRAGIERHFKTKRADPLCTAITGRTPARDRRAIIDRFNTDEGPSVMLLNVKAGGTAITLDTADRMIFISETRIPDQQLQAEDRIHRVSNPRGVMYYYLRSLGTVDVGTAYANQEAEDATRRLLDGRRGIDYVRHVLEMSH